MSAQTRDSSSPSKARRDARDLSRSPALESNAFLALSLPLGLSRRRTVPTHLPIPVSATIREL